jgi:ketopantoate reductase
MAGKPRILVVGAGAVGQVFGHHLARGGAALTFFVREKYRAEVARGFEMYRLPAFGGRERAIAPVRFEGFDVISSLAEISARSFDQVYVTLPSDAVRSPWMRELANALPRDATVVSLQPTREDRAAILEAGVPEDRLVSGMIAFVAYAAPLEGETRFAKPGMAYWFPPLGASPFSGPKGRARAVVELLRRGGLPARTHPDVPRAVGFPTAIGMSYLTALEAAGWSLGALARGPLLALGARAGREASEIVRHGSGAPDLGTRVAAGLSRRAPLVRMGLWIAERMAPFPVEEYLRVHFTKVGAQTRLIVASLIEQGREAALPVDALGALSSSVPRLPEAAGE